MKQPITVISDPGIDDVVALLLLAKLSPNESHTLVSTFGNAPEYHTGKNAREFILQAAPHWKYAQGATRPQKPLECPWPDYFHGPDGLWGVHPEVSGEVRYENEMSGEKNLISLGPMTDVADVMRKQKRGRSENMVVMGGAVQVPGNETPYSETNIRFDPDAAANVFEHDTNENTYLVPLDVTRRVSWTKQDVEEIPKRDKTLSWIRKLLLTWFEKRGEPKGENFDLHDPLAVYAAFFPNKLVWEKTGIEVVREGKERGQTVRSKENPPCNVALGLDNPEKIARHILELIVQ